jgi:hypothetical protein
MSSSSILILGALVILLAFFRSRKPAVLTPALLVVLAVALYGAVTRMSGCEDRKRSNSARPFLEAAGVMIGREIASAFPEGCSIAVVRMSEIFWADYSTPPDVELVGLRSVLDAKRYPLKILFTPMPEVETDPVPPDKLSMADLRALLAGAPDADAILLQRVKLDPEIKALPEGMPPIFSLLGSDTEEFLARGFFRAAVDVKPGADWEANPTGKMSPEEIFGMWFQLLRP